MSLVDFSAGAQGALQQLIARRLEAQRYAAAQQQQQFQNERLLKGDAMQQRQLDATLEGNQFNRERQAALDQSLIADRQANAADKQVDNARQGRETWTPGTLIGAQEPAVEQWTKAGVPGGIPTNPVGLFSSAV